MPGIAWCRKGRVITPAIQVAGRIPLREGFAGLDMGRRVWTHSKEAEMTYAKIGGGWDGGWSLRRDEGVLFGTLS